mgnify:CR=1 FL=1
MAETVVLVFKDNLRFEWNVGSLRDAKKAVDIQKKHGNPVAIIGEGKVAQTLRIKYAEYNKDPKSYKMDVFGTASKLKGVAADELESKFKKITKRLKRQS